MVQFNLLPDVKLQYIKARRTKRLVTLASLVVIAASLAVFVIAFFSVNVVQKKSLSDLNKDIKTYSNELQSIKDLDKILTVQNQLNTLTDLHEKKVVGSRLFGYLSQVTPAKASITKLSVDFALNTISISGETSGLDVVNTYTDTLKATTYKVSGSKEGSKKAFSDVVLSTFGRDEKKATYTITATFDPTIFSGAGDVVLTVPNQVTTDPASLFQEQTGEQ